MARLRLRLVPLFVVIFCVPFVSCGGGGGSDHSGDVVATDDPGSGNPVPDPVVPEELDVCAAIRDTRIEITDSVTPVVVQNEDPSCPVNLNNLITVRSSGSIAFTYELLPERPELLAFDPPSDTLNAGERQSHDGVYFCNSTDSFTTMITANIVHYLLPSGESLSLSDAVDRCGDDVDGGNASDSTLIAFQVSVS